MNKMNSYNDIDNENLEIAQKIKEESHQIPIKEPIAFEELLKEAETKQPKRTPVNFRRLTTIAACFVVAIGVGSSVFLHNSHKNQRRTLLSEKQAIAMASDYDQIYNILKSNYLSLSPQSREDYGIRHSQNMIVEEDASFRETNDVSKSTVGSSSEAGYSNEEKDYSQTNVQTENIDEEDIIRTNGDYIFTLHQSSLMGITQKYTITISKVDKEAVSTVSTIDLPINNIETFCGLYVYEDYLMTIGTTASEYYDTSKKAITGQTTVYTYNISNAEKPVLESTNIQDGYYISSRMKEQYLYTITSKMVFSGTVFSEEHFIPEINQKKISSSNIYLSDNGSANGFTVITGLDVTKSSDFSSVQSVLGNTEQIYASQNNLYVINNYEKQELSEPDKDEYFPKGSYRNSDEEDYAYDFIKEQYPNVNLDEVVQKRDKKQCHYTSTMDIVKFSYNKGTVTFVATTETEGNAENNLFFDEKDDYLRFVATNSSSSSLGYRYTFFDEKGKELYHYYDSISYTTSEDKDSTTSVIVLDTSLKKVASINGLAYGEDLYAARYLGDYGYFVTFQQTDPLFTVDFSDMKHPKIASELKMPGYSSYLHFYKDNLLFGLGEEDYNGNDLLKLEMYDISENNAKQQGKLLIGTDSEYSDYSSDAISDYKALLIDLEKNLIGFSYTQRIYLGYCLDDYYNDSPTGCDPHSYTFYDLYTYQNQRFKRVLHIELSENENLGVFDEACVRGFYINNYFYVVDRDNGIYVVNLDTYKEGTKPVFHKF